MKEGTLTTCATQTTRIKREYDEQLYADKLDDLGETDTFLKTHNQSNLDHEEIKI